MPKRCAGTGFLYAISCMHCMTVSLAQGGEGLGTMWGRERATSLLRDAGFSSIEIHELDIQNDFYVVRPRPRWDSMSRDPEATRTAIMDVAESLILDRGFAGATVSEIVEAAGVTKGAFFHHFDSKKRLAHALVERYARLDQAHLDAKMDEAERRCDDPLQQMLTFVRLFEEEMEALAGPSFARLPLRLLLLPGRPARRGDSGGGAPPDGLVARAAGGQVPPDRGGTSPEGPCRPGEPRGSRHYGLRGGVRPLEDARRAEACGGSAGPLPALPRASLLRRPAG